MSKTILDRILDGRTDLVFDCLSAGLSTTATDSNGVPLIRWCAYYGDVSAIRFLLGNGESLGCVMETFRFTRITPAWIPICWGSPIHLTVWPR